jgi:hypothetical protein
MLDQKQASEFGIFSSSARTELRHCIKRFKDKQAKGNPDRTRTMGLEELTRGYCVVAATPSSRDRRRRRRRGGRRRVVAPRVRSGGGGERESDGARARSEGQESRRRRGGGGRRRVLAPLARFRGGGGATGRARASRGFVPEAGWIFLFSPTF